MKYPTNKLLILAGLTLGLTVRSHPAIAIIIGTYEAKGVQSTSVSGATTENFDSYSTGKFTNLSSNIGTYDQGAIIAADQYGGAGGTGNYLVIGANKTNSLTTTLTLKTPARYFGLWWSAGDSNNTLEFDSGARVIGRITSQDIQNLITAAGSSYNGNPTTKFSGQDSNEPFIYLNFFADPNNTIETFDTVKLTNATQSTGFESDNHSVATTYTSTRGTQFAKEGPFEPSFGLGLVAFGTLLFGSRISKGILSLLKSLRSGL